MTRQLLEYPFQSETLLKKYKTLRRELLSGDRPFLEKRIAILGGSTTNDIRKMLELFLLKEGIKPSFYESEYAQYWQDAMFGNPALEEFKPDIVIVHTTNRNIRRYPQPDDGEEIIGALLDEEYGRFRGMWDKLRSLFTAPIIQNNFEYPFRRLLGNKDASDPHGRVNFITRLNLKFYEYAQTHSGFFISDINYLSADYGLEAWSDPFYWHMYKYALCLPAIPRFSHNLANIVKSIYGKNKKAFALDLDNTLWGGVVGDDGADNLELGRETSIGQAYSEFQDYLKEHKKIGVLLSVISKNDHENALSGLNRPDSALKPDDFTAFKANWEPKSVNLVQMAEELALLPESFVFVDDNPAERAIVRRQVPDVSIPEIEKPEHYIHIIDRSGFFEVTNMSRDDLERGRMYMENAERGKLLASFENYGDYLLSLEMRAEIKPFASVYMSRIAQLTNKSNQFNLTTKRYTQEEIEAITSDKSYITLYGKLTDKFGDNGVVSVVIGEARGEKLHVILWLMSCRVLKRGVESAMMDELVRESLSRGVTEIRGYYYPTAKNGMVRDFYKMQGFEKESEDEKGGSVWRLPIDNGYQWKNHVIGVNL